ncbi:MAG: hypothetical protein VYC11_01650, partial [Candidatus Thermoplasmatota archaeon]|nr:hypothetical protein [Candidatus Thermoplasmatota archaeon]
QIQCLSDFPNMEQWNKYIPIPAAGDYDINMWLPQSDRWKPILTVLPSSWHGLMQTVLSTLVT